MGKANYDLPDDKLARVIRFSGARSKREAKVMTASLPSGSTCQVPEK